MYEMNYNGFVAKIMKAPRLTGNFVHNLPLGRPISVYPVDAFEHPLQSWVQGAGNYVVPVDPNWGLWFDFTGNDEMNSAVLLSIKGMNPITGQRTNGYGLERYVEKCPIHDEPFKDGLFCEKCNFKWPVQNYVTHPNRLWWDGFRSENGKVRQFFFTEELAKSIPELVIGKEDTVPAFGFAFFKSKVRRETVAMPVACGGKVSEIKYFNSFLNADQGTALKGSSIHYDCQSSTEYKGMSHEYNGYRSKSHALHKIGCLSKMSLCSESLSDEESMQSMKVGDVNNILFEGDFDKMLFERSVEKSKLTSEVGVGAGAEIYQNLVVDQLKVTDWEEKPESVMRLFFVFVDQFKDIEAKGMKDLQGEKNGYMAGLPVG